MSSDSTKLCIHCNQNKPYADFSKRHGIYVQHCKACHRAKYYKPLKVVSRDEEVKEMKVNPLEKRLNELETKYSQLLQFLHQVEWKMKECHFCKGTIVGAAHRFDARSKYICDPCLFEKKLVSKEEVSDPAF